MKKKIKQTHAPHKQIAFATRIGQSKPVKDYDAYKEAVSALLGGRGAGEVGA